MRLELVRVLGINKTITNVNVNGKQHNEFFYDSFDQVCFLEPK
jgi:hypothetical protein